MSKKKDDFVVPVTPVHLKSDTRISSFDVNIDNGIHDDISKTPEEILNEKLGKRNPFRIYERNYRKNLLNSFYISLIFYFIIVFASYALILKNANRFNNEEPPKLLVLDETTNVNLQDVSDPYKPKPIEEETQTADNTNSDVTKSVPVKTKANKFKPLKTSTSSFNVPRVGDTIDYTRMLDSLQKTTGKDTTGKNITANINGNTEIPDSLKYRIPDSLKSSIDTSSIAIRIRSFPKEWKFQRVDTSSFYFYFGGDTINSRGDSVILYLYLNSKDKEDDIKNFTKDFKLNDSLNVNLISKTIEPKEDLGTEKMIYRYIISGKADRLNIKASVNKKYLENNKQIPQIIEAIVRSISFRNPN